MQAAFVADKIWRFQLEPARNLAPAAFSQGGRIVHLADDQSPGWGAVVSPEGQRGSTAGGVGARLAGGKVPERGARGRRSS